MANKIATYEEIMRYWDINDVMRWHEILDAQEDYAWLQELEIKAKMGK